MSVTYYITAVVMYTYSGIFCTAEDALRMYNFAPKNSEAYEKCD